MKGISYLVIFLLSFFMVSCELLNRKVNLEGRYLESPGLKALEGTWQNINAKDTFQLELEVIKYFFEEAKVHMDVLVGEYYLTSVGNSNENRGKYVEYTLSVGRFAHKRKQEGKVDFSFFDFSKDKRGQASLEPIKGYNSTLQWLLKENEYRLAEWDLGFSVPTNAIMRKVK